MHNLPEFLVTVYVLILIPGPSVLFVISRGVALGRRAALATVLGNETGFMLQLTLVAIGVGSLVARSDAVFSALRLIGAAYLVFLGVRKIFERKSLAEFQSGAATPMRSPTCTAACMHRNTGSTSGSWKACGAACRRPCPAAGRSAAARCGWSTATRRCSAHLG